MSQKKQPLLATGKLGANYELLYKYWEIAKEKSREDSENIVLKREDFTHLEELLKKEQSNPRVIDIIEKLIPRFTERIDPEIAKKAYHQVYMIEINPEEARREVARILAIWLLEALESEGKIILR